MYSYGAQRFGWQTDLYWNAIFAAQGAGLEIGLPAAGAFVAYRASYQRAFLIRPFSTPIRNWVRVCWRAAWPAVVGLTVGTALTLFYTLQASGRPVGGFNAWVLAAFLSMAIVALTSSYIVGRLLPARGSIVIAILINYEWQLYPQLDGIPPWVRIVSGYVIWDSAFTPYLQTATGAIVAPVVLGIGLLVGACFLVARWIKKPSWSGVLLCVAAVAASIAVASTAAAKVDPRAYEPRADSALVCKGQSPKICLLPEQQSLAATATRTGISRTWRSAEAQSVELPRTVVSKYYGFTRPASRSRTAYVLLDERPSVQDVQYAYVSSIVHSYDCNPEEVSADDESRDEGAIIALARVSGLNAASALANYAGAGEGQSPVVRQVERRFNLQSASATKAFLKSYFSNRTEECMSGGPQ